MARTAGMHTLLADSMERIHRTPTEWMQFLSFHAQFYRYNTSNAALIYAQRPEATACATMNFWNNRLNRWIRRGSHGIRLLQPDGESIRYVFDVADTTGPPGTLPKIWSAAQKELPVFMDYISAPEGDTLQERIASLTREITEQLLPEILDDVQLNRQDTLLEDLDDLNLKVSCKDLVSNSAAYMTMARLGISPQPLLIEEDFRAVVDFSTPALQSILDAHVRSISKQILDSVELCVKYRTEILAERERFSEDLSKNGAEPPLQQPTFTQRYSQQEKTKEDAEHDRKVRNDAQNLSGEELPRDVRADAPSGHAEEPPAGDGHAGPRADQQAPQNESRTAEVQSAGLGGTHEQPEAHGGRTGAAAAGLRIIEGGQQSETKSNTANDREPSLTGSFSMPDTGQISMFALPQEETSEGGFQLGQHVISQEEIDLVLRSGSNEPRSALDICARFRWDKPVEENADFLRREFREDGKGFLIDGRQLSAWFSEDGVHLAHGNSAQIQSAVLLSWEDAAIRIRQLLDEGKYISQPEIDYSVYQERTQLGQDLWHAYRDDLGGLPEEWEMPLGFPEASGKLTDMLAEPAERSKIIAHLEKAVQQFENQEPPKRRWHNHQLLLRNVRDLDREPLNFQSEYLEMPEPQRFITRDEIDMVLRRRVYENFDSRIQEYFRSNHTAQEKKRFIKEHYGTGGFGSLPLDVWYDAKGLRIRRGPILIRGRIKGNIGKKLPLPERDRENPTAREYRPRVHRARYRGSFSKRRKRKVTGFMALYLWYAYRMGNKGKARPNNRRMHYLLREDIHKMDQRMAICSMLQKHHIQTEDDLCNHEAQIDARIAEYVVVRKKLYKRQNRAANQSEIDRISEEIKALRRELKLIEHVRTDAPELQEKKNRIFRDMNRSMERRPQTQHREETR